jgi:hypothetical protein
MMIFLEFLDNVHPFLRGSKGRKGEDKKIVRTRDGKIFWRNSNPAEILLT